MDVEQRLTLLEKSVISLQATTESIEKNTARIEASISKLTEVSSNLAKVVAVQQKTIEHDESGVKKNEGRIIELDHRLNQVRDEIRISINESVKPLFESLDQIGDQDVIDHDKINARINKIERYIWLMTGGGFIIGVLVTEFLPMIFQWFQHIKSPV